jgi:hypothetical protein
MEMGWKWDGAGMEQGYLVESDRVVLEADVGEHDEPAERCAEREDLADGDAFLVKETEMRRSLQTQKRHHEVDQRQRRRCPNGCFFFFFVEPGQLFFFFFSSEVHQTKKTNGRAGRNKNSRK